MDGFITMAEDFKNSMVQRGFNGDKIHVAYNGVDETQTVIHQGPKAFWESHQVPYNDQYLYVGIATRLHPVKGTDVFLEGALEVIKQRQDIHFVIAGFGDYKYEQQYKNFVKDNNIQDYVHFIGFVKHINDFYHACDINVNSSHTEAVCFALLEGGILKKPTIASNVGGTPELITDGTHGLLFNDNDHHGLKEAIITMAESPGLRQQMGQKLYERINETFTTEAMGVRYLEIYQTIERN